MPLSKNFKIGIVIFIALGISIPLVTWGVIELNRPPTWSIKLFGSTVMEEKSVSYNEIMNDSLFTHLIDAPFNYTKSNGQDYILNFSGITIWDLIVFSGVNYGAANAIRFHSSDGGQSIVTVNLTTIQMNASMVIIAYAENGTLFERPPNGDGPLKSIVDYRLTEPLISCAYATKWLTGIEFIIG